MADGLIYLLTDKEWAQLSEILKIEGFEGVELETLLVDFRRKPKLAREALNKWQLVTETKH